MPEGKEPWLSWDVEKPKMKFVWDILPVEDSIPQFLVFVIVCYLWTLPFLLLAKIKRPFFSIVIKILELFFCVMGASFISFTISLTGEIMLGGVVYFLSLVAYFCTTILQLLQVVSLLVSRPQ